VRREKESKGRNVGGEWGYEMVEKIDRYRGEAHSLHPL
jgi:hypothetical protein